MKISLDREEMMALIKKSYPKEMIPDGYEVTGVDETGPSYAKDFTISISKKVAQEGDKIE